MDTRKIRKASGIRCGSENWIGNQLQRELMGPSYRLQYYFSFYVCLARYWGCLYQYEWGKEEKERSDEEVVMAADTWLTCVSIGRAQSFGCAAWLPTIVCSW